VHELNSRTEFMLFCSPELWWTHHGKQRRSPQRKQSSNTQRKRRGESNENKFVDTRGVENFRKEGIINSVKYSCNVK